MSVTHRILLLAASGILSLAGCSSPPPEMAGTTQPPPASIDAPPSETYDYTHTVQQRTRRGNGPHWTVAILRLGDTKDIKDAPFGAGPDVDGVRRPTGATSLNKSGRDLVKHCLVQNEAFTVLERERIIEILRELNLAKSPYVNPDTAPKQQKVCSVRYIIEGTIGANGENTLQQSMEQRPDLKMALAAAEIRTDNLRGKEKQLAALLQMRKKRLENALPKPLNWACHLSAYYVQTGEVVSSVVGLGATNREAVEDAIANLVDDLAEKDSGLRVAAVVSKDKVFLDMGTRSGIKVNDTFDVIRQGKTIRNRHGQLLGHDESTIGQVRVTEVRDLLSVAKVVKSSKPIARGDLIRTIAKK
jgi:hypothetical protein